MNNYSALLGKWFNPDEILLEAICHAGEYPSESLLLAVTIKKLCARIDALEKEIKEKELK